jgi:hypothetical protein
VRFFTDGTRSEYALVAAGVTCAVVMAAHAGTADPRGASRVVDRAACRDAMVVVPEELKRLSPGRFGCTIQKWKSEMLSPRRARKHVSRPAVLVKHRARCPYRPPMISQ